jgi:transcription initiation factor IIE alpha subunit
MKHKIEINIADEDIEIIENIVDILIFDTDRNSYYCKEDAIALGILKQILREVNCLDKQ